MSDPQLIIGAVLIPLFVSYLIYVKNKYLRSDSFYTLIALALGCVIAFPAREIENFLDIFAFNNFIRYFFQVALIEEGLKFLVLYLFKNHIYDSFDSIKYSILISLGFATIENIFYAFWGIETGSGGYETIELRIFSAIPAHFLFALNMGYFFGLHKTKNRFSVLFLIMSLLCPVLMHGAYDLIIFPLSLLILILALILNYTPLKSFLES